MRNFFFAATFVVAFSIGIGIYNHGASAGDPSISIHVSANSGGAKAYPYPSISGPWTEGESYTGHGTALATLRGSIGDFFDSGSEAGTRWDYDDAGISVTIKPRINFAGIRVLYEDRSYPYASVSAYSGEYLDETTAYSWGWIYMYPSTDGSDYWPDM